MCAQRNENKQNSTLRVLVVSGAYPSAQRPHSGTFVKSQVDSLIAAGVQVEVIHPKPGPTPLRYLKAFFEVFRASLTKRFDIIHGQYGLWCAITRLQWTTPVIASFWGDDILGTVTTNGTHSKKSRMVAWLSHQLCYLVDGVIVKSEQMKQRAGGPPEKMYVVPNGVNFAQFRPISREEARAALGWEQGRYYVLFGNNPDIPVKNFSLAQAAMKQLAAQGIEANLMVANGLPHDKIVHYINASNALLLTSIAEGSPNVVKEAMACNVPVVATNVGDVAAVIGKTKGCYVCPHDARALAAGLKQALLRSQPTTGREDIQHLDNAVVAQQIIAIYKKAIGKHATHMTKEAVDSTPKDTVYAQKP